MALIWYYTSFKFLLRASLTALPSLSLFILFGLPKQCTIYFPVLLSLCLLRFILLSSFLPSPQFLELSFLLCLFSPQHLLLFLSPFAHIIFPLLLLPSYPPPGRFSRIFLVSLVSALLLFSCDIFTNLCAPDLAHCSFNMTQVLCK